MHLACLHRSAAPSCSTKDVGGWVRTGRRSVSTLTCCFARDTRRDSSTSGRGGGASYGAGSPPGTTSRRSRRKKRTICGENQNQTHIGAKKISPSVPTSGSVGGPTFWPQIRSPKQVQKMPSSLAALLFWIFGVVFFGRAFGNPVCDQKFVRMRPLI